jgi:hypothetical protein
MSRVFELSKMSICQEAAKYRVYPDATRRLSGQGRLGPLIPTSTYLSYWTLCLQRAKRR